MERYLREVIGNKLTLNCPPPHIPELMIYLLIKPMFGVFKLAIKFDCLFSGIFSKFSLICNFNFWQLAPLNMLFKWCIQLLFSQFQRKKTVSKELKTWYFPYSAFWLTGQWGGYSPHFPNGYATDGTASYYGESGPD